MLTPLPIDRYIPQIIEHLSTGSNLVLQASPGSGKTTRVPPALLQSKILPPQAEILVLEPRRLAAKLACTRVAEEQGTPIGEVIGYHFRLEKRTGPKTRLTYLTEGMLIRRALSDPALKNVSVVVLDEFHERHLHTDVSLAYLRHLQKTLRPDLKLLIMSATIESATLSNYLDRAPILEIDAPRFPVEMRYREAGEKSIEETMTAVIRDLLTSCGENQHLLAFLPGMREIRRTEERLCACVKNPIHILHGDLSKEAQEAALRPSRAPKVILATGIAESSVTIDGVSKVVDSGLERVASVSPWTGLSVLGTKAISKASAIQRAGRAGRQGPGICVRLYSQYEFESRQAFSLPEIRRSDLTQTVLELSALGIRDIESFPWFEIPDSNQLKASFELLSQLGALNEKGLTPTGKKMSSMPLHPRLAKLVLQADQAGCLESACRLAALISEGELSSLEAMHDLEVAPSYRVRSTMERLRSHFPKTERDDEEGLPPCILHAFPDRVGKIRKERGKNPKYRELVLATGGSALVEETPFVLAHDFFVILDAFESKRGGNSNSLTFAKALIPIEEAWLLDVPGHLLTENKELLWDPKFQHVSLQESLRYGQITLDDKAVEAPPNPETVQFFLNQILKIRDESLSWYELIEAFSKHGERDVIENSVFRTVFLAQQKKWTIPSPFETAQKLVDYFVERVSLKEFKAIDWENFFKASIAGTHSQEIDRLAPTHFELHGKRRAIIHYSLDKAPWIESRLQDFFGLRTPPSVLGGAVPLVLHLLAPNQRAVQVTQDLKGFWERHYPQLRQELSRRYPRHKWPLDPQKPESE